MMGAESMRTSASSSVLDIGTSHMRAEMAEV